MANHPLVSVIMPAYNAQDWIAESIESILNQTYPSIEVIVIDDASTDKTGEIVRRYASRNVRLLRNERQLAVSGSRNRGIEEASGAYIALLDSDDLWLPAKLEKQMKLFELNPGLGLVYCDCFNRKMDGTSWRYFSEWTPRRGDVFQDLLRESFVACLTAVIPKKVLDDVGVFKKEFIIAEEYELFLRISRKYSFDFVDEPLGIYRMHDRNISLDREAYYADRYLYLTRYRKDGINMDGTLALTYLDWAKERFLLRQIKGVVPLFKGLFWALIHPFQFWNVLLFRLQQRKRKKA